MNIFETGLWIILRTQLTLEQALVGSCARLFLVCIDLGLALSLVGIALSNPTVSPREVLPSGEYSIDDEVTSRAIEGAPHLDNSNVIVADLSQVWSRLIVRSLKNVC